MKFGVIDNGYFEGRRIILHPRKDMKDNEWYIETARSMNGESKFNKYCLLCEKEIMNECNTKHI